MEPLMAAAAIWHSLILGCYTAAFTKESAHAHGNSSAVVTASASMPLHPTAIQLSCATAIKPLLQHDVAHAIHAIAVLLAVLDLRKLTATFKSCDKSTKPNALNETVTSL
eukprot:16011-Heterococcus_DN1.PRE.2